MGVKRLDLKWQALQKCQIFFVLHTLQRKFKTIYLINYKY